MDRLNWNHCLTTLLNSKLLTGSQDVHTTMRFFVPFMISSLQAEQIYDRSKKRLEDIGFQMSDVRIQRLAFQHDGELVDHKVGDATPSGEIIAAILHSDVGYFVCTLTAAMVVEAIGPMPIRYTQLIMESSVVAVRYFEE